MTITQCSECGGKVSTTAQNCPYCGAPVGATEVPIPSPPVEQAQQEASHLGTVLIPLAVYAGVMLLVAVELPPLALVLVAAAAGITCSWPVGNARLARSLVTYAGLHITLWLWNESVLSSISVPRLGPGSSAEEINRTISEIASMEMVPPGNWWEVKWWFALIFVMTTILHHIENKKIQENQDIIEREWRAVRE